MDLDEMKILWSQMGDQLENQKKLTNKLIMEMTQARFRNRIGIVSRYEGIGSVLCFLMAAILLFKLPQLDTWYLLTCGILTAASLILIPLYVLHTIDKMKNIDIRANNYKDTIIEYTKRRKQFLLAQRLAIYFNFVLVLMGLPIAMKLFDDKDVFVAGSTVFYWYIPLMTVFLILFSRWGYGCYKRITASAEQMLRELDADR